MEDRGIEAGQLDPEDCASRIFNYSGKKIDPETASALWAKILTHKRYLSEKLERDVSVKVACVDFIENMDLSGSSLEKEESLIFLREYGAQMVNGSVWDTISDTQPPKQMVQKRIILPLTEIELALKHGVSPPRAIIFFGPPGTGKTHFVRAIAGVLKWYYIEVSPSSLMVDGEERLGANLKTLMESVRGIDEAVVFIDEFEEIAGSRDQASRIDKSITNEFLKQIPLFKARDRSNLLVCATNYISQLDTALLRPGRFDCIIPVGNLDNHSRQTIFEHYLATTNHSNVDVDAIIPTIEHFTPADIEYLFQKVRQESFEREFAMGEDYKVTTEPFVEMISKVRPTLNDEIIREFEEDCAKYTRL
ncbi:MAG: ATP-binding protein [Deltaproteobacteria bacterium]|nr:ATP-binding protein [Deltaproteobacteria bacterium]